MEINFLLAFWGGIISFFSPCVLPLYPSYLSYITGISLDQLKNNLNERELKKRVILHTLFFIFGISLIFLALGFGATLLGELFFIYSGVIRKIGGILIIIMGLFVMDIIKWKWLLQERRFHFHKVNSSYLSSFIIGISFAAGWTPCVGPILASILLLVSTQPTYGLFLIIVYTLGFAFPFFIMAFFISKIKALTKYTGILMRIGGIVMIIIGILLFSDQLIKITNLLNKYLGISWLG